MIPRLKIRYKTYYIRVSVPTDIQYLYKRKEICYSLGTGDYQTALSILRKESARIDLKIFFLRRLDMQIKGNLVTLTDMDLEKMLSYQLRRIDDYIERFFREIQSGTKTAEDICVFSSQLKEKYEADQYDPLVPETAEIL